MERPLKLASQSGPSKTYKNRRKGVPPIASARLSLHEKMAKGSAMCLELFVATKFIPEHVEAKSTAGRRHYYAILKHVLHPEKIDRLFSPDTDKVKSRMKSLPDWPYLDKVRLCDLQPTHVRQLTASASAHGYSTQTILHIRNVMSAIISHAKREKCFDGENPIFGVTLPPMARSRAQNLTTIQAKKMLQLMQYPEREITLMTMITGMSISDPDPNLLVSPSEDGTPVNPASLRMQRLRPIGRKLDMPGLWWQILTRAHNALMCELRTQFYDDLTVSAK